MSQQSSITSLEQVLLNFWTRTRGDAKRNRYNFRRLAVGQDMLIPIAKAGDTREVRRIREAAYQESLRRESKFTVRSRPGMAIVTRVQ